MPPEYSWVLQAGPSGILILVMLAIWRGDLRTRQEVDTGRQRWERAETQVDTILPALRRQTELIEKLADRP